MKGFISHSHADSKIAASISEALSFKGFDKTGLADISLGTSFSEEVARQIESADAVIVIMSERSAESLFVRQEIDLAIKGWNQNRLFLVQVDSAKVPIGLRDLKVFPFSTSELLSDESEKVAGHIYRSLAQKNQVGGQDGAKSYHQHDIFISYSRVNKSRVSDIVADIRRHDLSVFIDYEPRKASKRYAKTIAPAIRKCKSMLVIGSKVAFDSDHVAREIYLAGEYNKDFIVVLIEEIEIPDELNYFLTGFPRLNLIEDPKLDVGQAVRDIIP